VWTRDQARGRRLAERVEAGNVCVNDVIISYGVAGLPFGGVKESGIGRVHGADGLRSFCHTKSVLIDRFGPKREVWWYPMPTGLYGVGKRVARLRYRSGLGPKLQGLLR
jgi:hypothetical protein